MGSKVPCRLQPFPPQLATFRILISGRPRVDVDLTQHSGLEKRWKSDQNVAMSPVEYLRSSACLLGTSCMGFDGPFTPDRPSCSPPGKMAYF